MIVKEKKNSVKKLDSEATAKQGYKVWGVRIYILLTASHTSDLDRSTFLSSKLDLS